jgi:hypothetical protein
MRVFFFESGKGHAIMTYNTEYNHIQTSCMRVIKILSKKIFYKNICFIINNNN